MASWGRFKGFDGEIFVRIQGIFQESKLKFLTFKMIYVGKFRMSKVVLLVLC